MCSIKFESATIVYFMRINVTLRNIILTLLLQLNYNSSARARAHAQKLQFCL